MVLIVAIKLIDDWGTLKKTTVRQSATGMLWAYLTSRAMTLIEIYTLLFFTLNHFSAAVRGLVADRPWRRKWQIIERENLWERDGKIQDVVQRDFCGAHYVSRACETIRKNIVVFKRSRSLSPACARFDSHIMLLCYILYLCMHCCVLQTSYVRADDEIDFVFEHFFCPAVCIFFIY